MKTRWILLGLVCSLFSDSVFGQCTPPHALTCVDAPILLGLDQLNGFNCTTLNMNNAQHNLPLCHNGGSPQNISWWAFQTEGGPVDFSIEIFNCINGDGMQFGIYGDCNQNEVILCHSNPCVPVAIFNATLNFEACKTYYFFTDGCRGDICNFTLNWSGAIGPPPNIGTLGFINNDKDQTIEVCEINCPKTFFAEHNGDSEGCGEYYEWIFNGSRVPGENDDHIELQFDKPGKNTLSVVAYSGFSNGRYAQKTPISKSTIIVSDVKTLPGEPRNICLEKKPFIWHGHSIDEDGIYTHNFEIGCCKFDSVVAVKFLEKPAIESVYYFDCNNTIYRDPITKQTYPGCNRDIEVYLQGKDKWKCDSSYLINTVYPTYSINWKVEQFQNSYKVYPTIIKTEDCEMEYLSESWTWSGKSAPTFPLSKEKVFQSKNVKDLLFKYLFKFRFGSKEFSCEKVFDVAFPADFTTSRLRICVNDQVQCNPLEEKDVLQYFWEFENGTPATSTVRNPWVMFSKPGDHTIKLTVVTKTGTHTYIKEKYINSIQPQSQGNVSRYIDCNEQKKDITPLEDRSVRSIQVAPNPSNGQFFINTSLRKDEFIELSILDQQGREIYYNKLDGNESKNMQIPINIQQSGVYILKVKENDREYSQNIVIQ